MSNVVDSLPAEVRQIFVEVIGEHSPELLTALRSTNAPSVDDVQTVEDILSEEFCLNLDEDDEPTPRGALIDNAIGAFVQRWKIERT